MSLLLLFLLIAGAATSVNAGGSEMTEESGGEEVEPRIYGGRWPVLDEYPHLVTIFNAYVFWCQGVIISDYWVLTVANCLIPLLPEMTYVVMGLAQTKRHKANYWEPSWDSWNDTVSVVGSPVQYFRKHPKFTGNFAEGYQYDIALIQLKDSMKDKYEYRAALQAPWTVESIPNIYQKCYILGWADRRTTDDGRDKNFYGPLQMDAVPRYGENIHMVDQHKCDRFFPSNVKGSWGGKDGMQLCSAGTHGGTDPLLGDAGIPLMCDGVLIGLVSYSVMGQSLFPQGTIRYTRIAAYWDFIRMYVPDAIEYDADEVDDYDSVIDEFEELDTLKMKPKKCKGKG